MRTLLILTGLLVAAPLHGEERTWTIATNVITTKAELVAVRGDLAYLKIGDKIEEYPLVRLSASDQRYISSLALAPVLPGPGDDSSAGDILPVPPAIPTRATTTTAATPTTPAQTAATATDVSVLKSGPVLIAPVTEEAIPLPVGPTTNMSNAPVNSGTRQTAVPRTNNYGSVAPQALNSGATQQYRGVAPKSLSNLSPNDRRYLQSQQSSQQQVRKQSTAQQNQQNQGGLLNLRARRNDR